MLCAGSIQPERRVDSCRGDSGGPLVCERPGGGWVVYGVTSWGHACRTQQSPGVYTKVSAFSAWIRKVIGRADRKEKGRWTKLNWPLDQKEWHSTSLIGQVLQQCNSSMNNWRHDSQCYDPITRWGQGNAGLFPVGTLDIFFWERRARFFFHLSH